MQWVIDLVGLLPPVPAKNDMMIFATDYYTKWIEAETLSSIKEADVERFIWGNIICRFGCLQSLVDPRKTVAHKQRPKGDAGQQPKRPSGDAARKKRPKGDAGIDTQLPISSVLRETQGDDQGILRDVQNTPEASEGGPWHSPTS
ncbi:unnamed protein product [Prunus armeniaca]